jgi:hypothetical protein
VLVRSALLLHLDKSLTGQMDAAHCISLALQITAGACQKKSARPS